jgi:hypothetical protein
MQLSPAWTLQQHRRHVIARRGYLDAPELEGALELPPLAACSINPFCAAPPPGWCRRARVRAGRGGFGTERESSVSYLPLSLSSLFSVCFPNRLLFLVHFAQRPVAFAKGQGRERAPNFGRCRSFLSIAPPTHALVPIYSHPYPRRAATARAVSQFARVSFSRSWRWFLADWSSSFQHGKSTIYLSLGFLL